MPTLSTPGTTAATPTRHRAAPAVSVPLVVLSRTVAVLATALALGGWLWPADPGPSTLTTARGDVVTLLGEGLYRLDSRFAGAGYRGTDAVTLLIGVPLLLVALRWYRTGSVRATLLLAGSLSWFLYCYGSVALGAAYNPLFLGYVAVFSASLYGLVLALTTVDRATLAGAVSPRTPRRAVAALMLASAVVTAVVWLTPLLAAALSGDPPAGLHSATTMVTDALDLAVITPAAALAGWWLLAGQPTGYLVAVPLLVLEAMLAPMIAA